MAAAGLLAGASIAGSLVGPLANIGQSRRANKRMVDFWNMQNEYNHPRQQMQRLQEAGLNPNLVYGGGVSGASGQAGPVGRPDKPDMSSLSGIIPQVVDSLKTLADTNRIKAQADLTMAQTNTEQFHRRWLVGAQQTGQELKNELLSKTMESSIHGVKENTRRLQLGNELMDRTMPARVQEIAQKVQLAKENITGRQLNNALLELQRQFLSIGLDRNSPWYAKIFGKAAIEGYKKATQ